MGASILVEMYHIAGIGNGAVGINRVNRNKGAGVGRVCHHSHYGLSLVGGFGAMPSHLETQRKGMDRIENRVGMRQDSVVVGVGSIVVGIVSQAVVSAVCVGAVVINDGVSPIVIPCAGVDIRPAFGQVVIGTACIREPRIAVEVLRKRHAGYVAALGGCRDTHRRAGVTISRAEGTHGQCVLGAGLQSAECE